MAVFYVYSNTTGKTVRAIAAQVREAKIASGGQGYHFGEVSQGEAERLLAQSELIPAHPLAIAARIMEKTGRVPLRMSAYTAKTPPNERDRILRQIDKHGEVQDRILYYRRIESEVRQALAELMEEGVIYCKARPSKMYREKEITTFARAK